MRKLDVMIVTFPYGNVENPELSRYVRRLYHQLKTDERIGRVGDDFVDDTPTPMSRNRAVAKALASKADLLFMLDDDVVPDIGVNPCYPEYAYEGAKPFWDTAFATLLDHPGPCVVAAPYCGGPPQENVFVFEPASRESRHPNVDFSIEMVSRSRACRLAGVRKAAALPTGCMVIDLRCVGKLAHPYFDYEWRDEGPKCPHCGVRKPGPRVEKGSTEDVYFSRNCALAGIPQLCAYDCWAGHWKPKLVGRPTVLTIDAVAEQYREAILTGQDSRERLRDIGDAAQAESDIVAGAAENNRVMALLNAAEANARSHENGPLVRFNDAPGSGD